MDITTAEQAARAAMAAHDLSSRMGGHHAAYRAAQDAADYARRAEELAGPDDAEWVFRAQAAEGACSLARAYYDGPERGLARPWVFTNPTLTVAITLPEDQLDAITVGQRVWTATATEDGTDLEDIRVETVERITDARITTTWDGAPDQGSARYRRTDGRLVGSSRDRRPRTIYRVEH